MRGTRVHTQSRRRTFAAMAIALFVLMGIVTLDAPPASAGEYVRGSVMCVSQSSVVGVWIQAERGGSGWASWGRINGVNYNAWYAYTLPYGGRYQVHVGCGGTPQRWGSNNKSGYVYGGRNFTCYDTWSAYYARNYCQVT